MGLLDFLPQLDEDKKYGLLMAAAQMMSAPRGASNSQALGQGLLSGLQGWQGSKALTDRRAEEAQQRQLRQIQIDQGKQGQLDQQNVRGAYSHAYMPGNLAPNDDEGNQMPAAPQGMNMDALRQGLLGAGPAGMREYATIQQAMLKESPFGKPDVKDFTPESIQLATAGGRFDPTKLVPRVKMEPINTGNATQFVNLYNPGGPLQHNLSPADQQRIPIERAQLGVSVAKARDEGVQGLPGIPGQGFVTGATPGAAPAVLPRPQPQAAPQLQARPQPSAQVQPQTAPLPTGISPKQGREIAEKNAKEMPQDMASYQNAVANLDMLKKSATEIRHPSRPVWNLWRDVGFPELPRKQRGECGSADDDAQGENGLLDVAGDARCLQDGRCFGIGLREGNPVSRKQPCRIRQCAERRPTSR
jgi:hypothetical protein